jgi:N-acetylmuramoyl-L-alanine amidase
MRRRHLVTALAAFVLAMPPSAQLQAQGAELRIARGTEMRNFHAASHRGYAAYPAAALAALGANIEETPRGLRALLAGDTLTFDLFSPIFRDKRTTGQLASPVYKQGGTIYLPAQLFTEWLPAQRPETIRYRDGVLQVAGPQAPAAPPAASPTTPSAATPAAGAPAAKPNPAAPAAAAEPRVVIIDPGHGGKDPGNIGRGGIREKDLTLAVGRRLAEILREKGGYEVHLTRTTDTLIALADRPHLANRWKANRPAALFISIHANSVASTRPTGFETFFLSDARTEDERRVAEMENSAIEYEEVKEVGAGNDLDWIFNTLRNDFYIRASNDLAEVIQDRLATFHPGPNRGVKQAGFRVLVGAFMPAVLVEMAFLSNPAEAALLKDAAFQRKIASALAVAVDQYFSGHEHLWSAEAAGATPGARR